MAPFAMTFLLITIAIGAIAGRFIFKQKFAPWPYSVAHGLVGLVGLLMLTVAVVTEGQHPLLASSLSVMLVAVVPGVLLTSYHMRGRLAPKQLVFVHACIAAAGVAVLLSYVSGLV